VRNAPTLVEPDAHRDNDRKRGGGESDGEGVTNQEVRRFVTILLPEVCQAKVANDPCCEYDGNEIHDAYLKCAGAEYGNLHRHWERRERGNEDRDQPISLKPIVQNCAAAAGDVLHQQNFAAFLGNKEQHHAPGERSKNSEERSQISLPRPLCGNRNQESVNSANNGNAGRIEQRENEQTCRSPRKKKPDKVAPRGS
jgi:hypothetical protein